METPGLAREQNYVFVKMFRQFEQLIATDHENPIKTIASFIRITFLKVHHRVELVNLENGTESESQGVSGTKLKVNFLLKNP